MPDDAPKMPSTPLVELAPSGGLRRYWFATLPEANAFAEGVTLVNAKEFSFERMEPTDNGVIVHLRDLDHEAAWELP